MTSQDLIEHLSRGGSGSSGDSVSSGSSSCVLSQSKDDYERGAANTQSSFVNRIVPDERKPEREENKSKDKPEESVLTATNGVSSSGKKDRRCKIVIDTDALMPYPGQIAGHGMVKRINGKVLKPLQPPPRGDREVNFYEEVQGSNEAIDKEIRNCLPEYFGVEKVSGRNGEMADEEYIVLEDITGGLELPNIMDIKIGARTWGLDANDKKIQTEEASYPGTKKPFGFSILGLILHPIRGTSDEMTKYDKKLGKALKTEEIQTMPKLFFDFDNSGLIKDLVELVIERLEQILDVYDRQRKYLAFASSVLFVYDVKVVRQFLQNGDRDQLAKAVRVKLIDFAHTFHSGGVKDDNFVGGIRSLIQVFRDYVEISSNETKNPN